MGDSNRTVRERLLDRVVLRTMGFLFLIAFICPVLNSEFLSPYVNIVPLYPDRPSCNELPAPHGGNQRSLLAYESDSNGALSLELTADDRFQVGSSVTVTVTFKNEHKAPIILHFPTNPEFLITNIPTSQGVNFILTVNDNPIAQPGASYQPPASFDMTTLHLLGPRSTCQQEFTLPWATLQSIGVNVGNYRIRARYGNTNPGSNPTGFPDPVVATAIPEYTLTQGVWTGAATSNEISFEIYVPAQPAQ